jgi:hypothetical protein
LDGGCEAYWEGLGLGGGGVGTCVVWYVEAVFRCVSASEDGSCLGMFVFCVCC